MDAEELDVMQRLEAGDFSALEWRATRRAVDLRFWCSALTSMDSAIKAALVRSPALLATNPPPLALTTANTQEEDLDFIVRCLHFYKNLLDMGFFRQYSFVDGLIPVLHFRDAQVVLLALEVFQSLAGGSEWQFDHRAVFRRRLPAPYNSKASGESEKDWSLEEQGARFEFLVEWANFAPLAPAPDGEEEENALDAALAEFDASFASDGTPSSHLSRLHKLRAQRSRTYALRVQFLLFCLFAPSRSFRKRIKVNVEDALQVVFDTNSSSSRTRGSDLVAASKVIRTELASPSSSHHQLFSTLISSFTGRGCLVEAIQLALAEASAGPELRLGLSFARVAMRSNTEDFFLRLETLLVLAIACLQRSAAGNGEGFQLLVNGGVYEALFSWVTAALAREDALEENECFALSAALLLFESFVSAEEHPEETAQLISNCHNLVSCRASAEPLSFAQRNLLCGLLSLLCNAASVCATNAKCESLLVDMLLDSPQRFGGSALLNACELIHECGKREPPSTRLLDTMTVYATTLVFSAPTYEYESLLAVTKFLLPALTSNFVWLESFLRQFFALYQNPAWYGALFFGSTSLGQHLGIFFSHLHRRHERQQEQLGEAAAGAGGEEDKAAQLAKIIMEEWAKPLPPLGIFLSIRLLGELCHCAEFSQAFLKYDGLNLLLHRTSDRSSTVVKVIQNVAMSCRKELFEALCALVVLVAAGGEDGLGEEMDFLCEMLVLVLSSSVSRHMPVRTPASLASGEAFFACMDKLSAWERAQKLPNRHFARLLLLLPSFTRQSASAAAAALTRQNADLERLVECFAVCLEQVLDTGAGVAQAGEEERVLCRAYKLVLREKTEHAFLDRLTTFGSLDALLRVICVGLVTRPALARSCLEMLNFFAERRVEAKMHQALMGMILAQLHAALDLGEEQVSMPDSVLCDLVQFFVSKFVQTKFTKQQQQQQRRGGGEEDKAAASRFVPSRQVVLSLYDMGFSGTDIRFAQAQIQSNDAAQITAYLIANPRPPPTDEDELNFALWLSQDGEEEEQPSAPAAAPTPTPAPAQAEAPEINLVDQVKTKLLALCRRVTLTRPIVPVVLSPTIHATALSSSVQSPHDGINTMCILVNATGEEICISAPRGMRQASAAAQALLRELVLAPQAEVRISTFVGNLLTVTLRASRQVLGHLLCTYYTTKVRVVREFQPLLLLSDSTEFASSQIHQRRLVSFQALGDGAASQAEPITVPLRIVNSSQQRVIFYHMYPFAHWRDLTALDASFAVEPRSELMITRRRNSVWAGLYTPTMDSAGFLLVPNASEKELVVCIPASGGGLGIPNLSMLCSLAPQLQIANAEDGPVFSLDNPVCLLLALQQERSMKAHGGGIDRSGAFQRMLDEFNPKKRKRADSSAEQVDWDSPLRAKYICLLHRLGVSAEEEEQAMATNVLSTLMACLDELNMWELEATFAYWASLRKSMMMAKGGAEQISLARLVSKTMAARSMSGMRCIQHMVERRDVDVVARHQDLAHRTFSAYVNNRRVSLEAFVQQLGEVEEGMASFFESTKDQLSFERRNNSNGGGVSVFITACAKPQRAQYIAGDKKMDELLDLLEDDTLAAGEAAFVLAPLCQSISRITLHLARRDALLRKLVHAFCTPAAAEEGGGGGEEQHMVVVLKHLAHSSAEGQHARTRLLLAIFPLLVVDKPSTRVCQLLLLLLHRNPGFFLLCEREHRLSQVVLKQLSSRTTTAEEEEEGDYLLMLFEYLSSRRARELVLKTTAESSGLDEDANVAADSSFSSALAWRDELREMDYIDGEDRNALQRGWPGMRRLPPSSAPLAGGAQSNTAGRLILASPTGMMMGGGGEGGAASSMVMHPFGLPPALSPHPSMFLRQGVRMTQLGRHGSRTLLEQETVQARHDALRELMLAHIQASESAATTTTTTTTTASAEKEREE